jgi:hypothetical protein
MELVTKHDEFAPVVVMPTGAAVPTPSFGLGRHCDAPGCSTVLSRYNPGTRCSVHGNYRK